jgi:hypothetical protein
VTYSLTDDKTHADPRRFVAGLEAMGLFAIARTWISDLLMDGFIPTAVAISLAGGNKVLIQRLVDAGYWASEDGGYRDVDYLVANLTRAEVEKRRADVHDQRVKAGVARAKSAPRTGGKFTSVATTTPPARDQRAAGVSASETVSEDTTGAPALDQPNTHTNTKTPSQIPGATAPESPRPARGSESADIATRRAAARRRGTGPEAERLTLADLQAVIPAESRNGRAA